MPGTLYSPGRTKRGRERAPAITALGLLLLSALRQLGQRRRHRGAREAGPVGHLAGGHGLTARRRARRARPPGRAGCRAARGARPRLACWPGRASSASQEPWALASWPRHSFRGGVFASAGLRAGAAEVRVVERRRLPCAAGRLRSGVRVRRCWICSRRRSITFCHILGVGGGRRSYTATVTGPADAWSGCEPDEHPVRRFGLVKRL